MKREPPAASVSPHIFSSRGHRTGVPNVVEHLPSVVLRHQTTEMRADPAKNDNHLTDAVAVDGDSADQTEADAALQFPSKRL